MLDAALPLLLGAALASPPLTLVVRTHHREGERMELTLAAGGESCVILLLGDGEYHESRLTLPANVGEMSLAETGKGLKSSLRRAVGRAVAQTLPVLDLGALVAPLRAAEHPMGARFRKLLDAKKALESKYAALAESAAALETSPPAPASEIAAAEKRLGYALPAEHVSLLRDVGAPTFDDSYFMSPERLMNAYDQMLVDWGTPKHALEKSLAPETAAFLRQSTILYTEVGDGLGAWIYAPKSTECGGGPAFYWLHEEWEINDPKLLKNRDGKCKTYTQALVWLIYQQVLIRYEDDGGPFALVDRSSPGPLRMDLDKRSWGWALHPIWPEVE